MEPIKSAGLSIYFESGLKPLRELLEQRKYSKIFVFADAHTAELCLPKFQEMMDGLEEFDIIETDPGEENKTIDFCIGIWKTLLDFEADRKSLMINLGGGVITDMGGFVASTYKRGIDFINIPTTLLSQVDASVGGKTGIDVDHVKNMVGTFSLPQAVFIEHAFLTSLPERELLSGFAEMIKHGLIAEADYFRQLKSEGKVTYTPATVYRSIEIKNEVVTSDPLEKGLRKILNFGHTIGHAVESYALSHTKRPLTHGEAIAVGMVCEAFLSEKYGNLSASELDEISTYITGLYPKYQIPEKSFSTLIELMQSDKKNEEGQIMFSLLEKIGQCSYNCMVTHHDIVASLTYYNSLTA
ncbi:MAG: 3-dehydroquinate synthase [Pedobacter sp.]|nr:3-dehydroquinate synthase [Pedobacter sp.]